MDECTEQLPDIVREYHVSEDTTLAEMSDQSRVLIVFLRHAG